MEFRAPEFLKILLDKNNENFCDYDFDLYFQALVLVYTDYCQVSLQHNEKFQDLLKSWKITRATQIDQNSDNPEEGPVLTPLFQDLRSIFKDSSYFDVRFTFENEDISFSSHKSLLALRSSFFRAMFEFEKSDVVLIKTISPQIFYCILEYVCTDHCSINLDNVVEILEAADHYNLPGLKLKCTDIISSNIEEATVISLYEKSKLYHCKELSRTCIDYILKLKILPSRLPEFTHIPTAMQSELLLYSICI